MKIYQGVVKEGKVEVAEPDGSKAVLIFDTQPSVAQAVMYEKKTDAAVPVRKARTARRDKIFRAALDGKSVNAYIRGEKARGVDKASLKRDLVSRFARAGIDLRKDRSCRLSVAAAVRRNYPADGGREVWNVERDMVGQVVNQPMVPVPVAVPKPVQIKPKVYVQTALVADAPTNIKRDVFWKSMLNKSMKDYVFDEYKKGLLPDAIADGMIALVKQHGYTPVPEAIRSTVYLKISMSIRGLYNKK